MYRLNVNKVGTDADNCAEHFITFGTNRKVVKVTHPKTKTVNWYFATEEWEPETEITDKEMIEYN